MEAAVTNLSQFQSPASHQDVRADGEGLAELDVGRAEAGQDAAELHGPLHFVLRHRPRRRVDRQAREEAAADAEQLQDALNHRHRAARPVLRDPLRVVDERQAVVRVLRDFHQAHVRPRGGEVALIQVTPAEAPHEDGQVAVRVHARPHVAHLRREVRDALRGKKRAEA